MAGKRLCFSLGVKIKGARPATLRELGDEVFEANRREAQAALDKRRMDLGAGRERDAEWHRKMYELLTGRPIRPEGVPLADMLEQWKRAPHARQRSERYVERAFACARDFNAWMAARYPNARAMNAVTPEAAREWAGCEAMGKLAPGTYNSRLILVRSVFEHLLHKAGLQDNPFDGIPLKGDVSIHRAPLAEEQVDAVIRAADPVIQGPMLAAAETAMREGDCCMLRWGDVDLKSGFITVKTRKTGERIEVPILKELRAALRAQKRHSADAAGFVWPEAAAMYQTNRCGISYRVRRAFKAAGIVRSAKREGPAVKKNASLYDFHALRTTWITRALTAGVPMEMVRRVTGHRTAEIVAKHYFHPDRERMAEVIGKAMGGTERSRKGAKARSEARARKETASRGRRAGVGSRGKDSEGKND
ncbi:MAG: tyrosine-type recombinase/integrase [Verrucomicrobia bacterium]|nr:tyrosine-type recombinase/integrase [Verrucomicrobiota bacterium]